MLSNKNFETNYPLPYTKKHSPDWYKHLLIDTVLTVFVEQRIALPVFFFGMWEQQISRLTTTDSKTENSLRVIELIMNILLTTPEKYSNFLKAIIEYINCLNKSHRLSFPDLNIQDAMSLQSSLPTKLSQQLRINEESFSDNSKFMMIFNLMCFLQLASLKEFLKI